MYQDLNSFKVEMSFMKSAWSDSTMTQINQNTDKVKSMGDDLKNIQAK